MKCHPDVKNRQVRGVADVCSPDVERAWLEPFAREPCSYLGCLTTALLLGIALSLAEGRADLISLQFKDSAVRDIDLMLVVYLLAIEL